MAHVESAAGQRGEQPAGRGDSSNEPQGGRAPLSESESDLSSQASHRRRRFLAVAL